MLLQIKVDGTPHTITPTAGDLVRLEREYGISAAILDQSSFTIEYVVYLAFVGLRRLQVIDREMAFDDFLDLADVDEGGAQLHPPPPLPPS